MEVNAKFNYDQYKTLQEKAQWFAYYCHGVTMHMYDGKPYFEAHLMKVYEAAKEFIHLIPYEKWDVIFAACWAHDMIEDARVTYNDIKDVLGEEVADIVYALTNEKGRSRAERANERYYHGIRCTPYASFVKICDRIANIEYSSRYNSKMLQVYRKEEDSFEASLTVSGYDVMFDYMHNLLYNEKPNVLR